MIAKTYVVKAKINGKPSGKLGKAWLDTEKGHIVLNLDIGVVIDWRMTDVSNNCQVTLFPEDE